MDIWEKLYEKAKARYVPARRERNSYHMSGADLQRRTLVYGKRLKEFAETYMGTYII